MSSADLYLTDPLFAIEYVRHDPDHRMTNFHYHQSYELYFLEEGAHPMLIQDSIHELASYDVALFKPQVFHKSRRNQSCARTCVYFTDRFLRLNFTERSIRSLLSCFDQDIISVSREAFPRVKKLLLRLEQEQVSNPDNRIFIYLAELLNLLNESKGAPRLEHKPSAHAKFTPILTYINQNYNQLGSIEEIADQFKLSKYYLCRIFKEATGLTLMQYINSIKIQNACNLLVNSDLSILEIGAACGFNSSMYFCKIFKQALSVTPSEFRKNAQ